MVGSTNVECNFAIVQQVTIVSIDDRNVSFTTRGTGPSGGSDDNLRKTFTVAASEIYPRAIDGAPPPVQLVPGATGNLFLSRVGWTCLTDDGFRIYGSDHAIFKYPHCGAITSPIMTQMTVIPTSIVVRGHLPEQTIFYDIELAGPDAHDDQHIVWNGVDYIAVRLTARGARRMGVGAHAKTVELWPTRIRIKGSPAIDQAVLGEVDVLDREMADCTQTILFSKSGAVVTLRLTQDGVNAFHVTPQAVLEASGEDASAVAPAPAGHGTGHHLVGVTRRRSPG
ncbi:MAG TPA: hypothetical protein VLM79_38525 [Kofleriaceae bacterium]|nr:hypothetical protein [Kofleriaceae bacterium]